MFVDIFVTVVKLLNGNCGISSMPSAVPVGVIELYYYFRSHDNSILVGIFSVKNHFPVIYVPKT